ncbi:MAG: hypothetical protein ACRCV3_05010 [Desulfovibrionaceae bacterium]
MKTNRAMGAQSMLMSPAEKAKAQDKIERDRLKLEKGTILRRGSWDSSSRIQKRVVQKRLSLDLKQRILSSTVQAQEELLLGEHDKDNLTESRKNASQRMYARNNNIIFSLEQSIANTGDCSAMDASLSLGELYAITNIEAAEISTLQQYGISSSSLSQLKVENKMLQVSLRKAAKELIASFAKVAEATQSSNPKLTAQQRNDLKALQLLSLNYVKSMQTLIIASNVGSPETLLDENNEATPDGQNMGLAMKQQLAGLLSMEMLEGGTARGSSLSCVKTVSVIPHVKGHELYMDHALKKAEHMGIDLEKPFALCGSANDVIKVIETLAEMESRDGRPLLNMRSVLSSLLISIENYIQSQGASEEHDILTQQGLEWGSHYTEGESVELGATVLSKRITKLHSSASMALLRVLRAFVDANTGTVDTLTALMKEPRAPVKKEPSDEVDFPAEGIPKEEDVEGASAIGEGESKIGCFDVSNFINLVRLGNDLCQNEEKMSRHNFMVNMPTEALEAGIFSQENMEQFGEFFLHPGLILSLYTLEEKGLITVEQRKDIAKRCLEQAEERWNKERVDLFKRHFMGAGERHLAFDGSYRGYYDRVRNLLSIDNDEIIKGASIYFFLKRMSSQ